MFEQLFKKKEKAPSEGEKGFFAWKLRQPPKPRKSFKANTSACRHLRKLGRELGFK